MGVNLIGKLNGFVITTENFKTIEEGGDGSVNLGCVNKGEHRVLRFNMITYNIGDKDWIIGSPKDRLDIFEPSTVFKEVGFQFRKPPFFVYNLRNDDHSVNIYGYKIPYCFEGLDQGCGYQGIKAHGGEDTYGVENPCQFVVIDNIPDGEYILEATVNAPSVEAAKTGKGKIIFEEDNYDDNVVNVRIKIEKDQINIVDKK